MPDGCPPCDIIILSYAQVSANALFISKQAEAVDELYNQDSVSKRLKQTAGLHESNVSRLQKIIAEQENHKVVLAEILRELSPNSPGV